MKSMLEAIAPEPTQHLAFLTEPRRVTTASPGAPCIWPGSYQPCPRGPPRSNIHCSGPVRNPTGSTLTVNSYFVVFRLFYIHSNYLIFECVHLFSINSINALLFFRHLEYSCLEKLGEYIQINVYLCQPVDSLAVWQTLSFPVYLAHQVHKSGPETYCNIFD